MKPYQFASAVALSTLLVACGDDDNASEPQPTALVRVVNASPSTATADLFVGGQSTALGTGLTTGSAGASCLQVPAGSQTLDFRQGGGTSIASASPFTFVAGQRYTAVLTGSGTTAGSRSVVVLADDATVPAPAAGQNAIRFVNATGVSANVYVTAPGTALGSANQTGLTNNTATTGGTGGFASYPTTSTQIRVFPTGSPTTGTPTVSFTLPALGGSSIATVVLVGGTGAQAIVATPCP